MPKEGGEIAIGVGMAIGLGAVIYFATKAEAKPPPPSPGKANLYGKVTDADTGYPLAGVLVTIDGLSTLTNTSGGYSFTNLAPGSYTVIFEKEGYQPLVR